MGGPGVSKRSVWQYFSSPPDLTQVHARQVTYSTLEAALLRSGVRLPFLSMHLPIPFPLPTSVYLASASSILYCLP